MLYFLCVSAPYPIPCDCFGWRAWGWALGGFVSNSLSPLPCPIYLCIYVFIYLFLPIYYLFIYLFYTEEPFSFYSDQTSYLSICLEEHSQFQLEHFSQEEIKKKVLPWPVYFSGLFVSLGSWYQSFAGLEPPSSPACWIFSELLHGSSYAWCWQVLPRIDSHFQADTLAQAHFPEKVLGPSPTVSKSLFSTHSLPCTLSCLVSLPNWLVAVWLLVSRWLESEPLKCSFNVIFTWLM